MSSGASFPQNPTTTSRASILTLAAMAALAYIAADMVHEALGHLTVCLLLGIKPLAISTVALQTAHASRYVAAAGTLANLVVGIAVFWCLSRSKDFSPASYFLWMLGFLNLMNSGYLVASALLMNGDWAFVISGRSPIVGWRTMLGLTGFVIYARSVRWACVIMVRWINAAKVPRADMMRIALTAYFSGGIVMTVASLFNPVGPWLILSSGIAASFGLTFGFLMVPYFVNQHTQPDAPAAEALRFDLRWCIAGLLGAAVFVAILGRGIRFA